MPTSAASERNLFVTGLLFISIGANQEVEYARLAIILSSLPWVMQTPRQELPPHMGRAAVLPQRLQLTTTDFQSVCEIPP